MRINVSMGALAKPLHEQLGVSEKAMAHLQKDADAIMRLKIRGLLADSEATKARNRLMKKIAELVR